MNYLYKDNRIFIKDFELNESQKKLIRISNRLTILKQKIFDLYESFLFEPITEELLIEIHGEVMRYCRVANSSLLRSLDWYMGGIQIKCSPNDSYPILMNGSRSLNDIIDEELEHIFYDLRKKMPMWIRK